VKSQGEKVTAPKVELEQLDQGGRVNGSAVVVIAESEDVACLLAKL
jgi:hypothetical protein